MSAYEQMRMSSASTRHIVVLTDGLSQPGDFDSLAERIADEGITVSTVAIGKGIDTALLQKIARRAGGAFHATDDFKSPSQHSLSRSPDACQ
ncbi:MAG: VWA domain-containing protein [Deinococcales bacterium]